MSDPTEHHLEHAEHVQHHAQHPFDTRVAVTMAILAAVLAGVTLSSHRGHTETLRLATEATALHTQATDKWNEYQAKNIRGHEFKSFLMLEALVAKEGVKTDPAMAARRQYWIDQIDKYEGTGAWAKFEENLKGTPAVIEGRAQKGGELATLQAEAKELTARAKHTEHASHELHGLVTWIDFGHLGLELALVFCAVSVLTKSRHFWITGIVTGILGTAVAGYGMVMWRFVLDAGSGVHP
jgi:hypothetical protein